MKITLKGTLSKASTTIDGSWRLSVDVPIHNSELVSQLMNELNEPLFICFLTEDEIKENDVNTLEDGLTEWLDEDLSL